MKVRATQTGFYDLKRRYEGDVFTLHDPKVFSEKWMEKVDGKPAAPKPVEVQSDAETLVSSDDDVI